MADREWWTELGHLGRVWKEQEGAAAHDLDRLAKLAVQAEWAVNTVRELLDAIIEAKTLDDAHSFARLAEERLTSGVPERDG